jgi:hypothetical protein
MLTAVCGSAVAPTLLSQSFCCLLLLKLNFIALCFMPTAILIFCVPFVIFCVPSVIFCVPSVIFYVPCYLLCALCYLLCAFCYLLVPSVIFCVPSVTLQLQSVCEIKFSNFKG